MALDPECGPGGCGVTICDWTWVLCLPRTCCDSHFDWPPCKSVFSLASINEFRIERSFGGFCPAVYVTISMTEGIVPTRIVVDISHSGKCSWLDYESWRKKIKYCNVWG